MGLRNIGLRPRLVGAFVLVASIAAVIGWRGLTAVGEGARCSQRLGRVNLAVAQCLGRIDAGQQVVCVGERGLANRRLVSGELRRAQYVYMDEGWSAINSAWKRLESLPLTSAERTAWKHYAETFAAWKSAHQGLVSVARQRDVLARSGVSGADPRIVQLDERTVAASLQTRKPMLSSRRLMDAMESASAKAASDAVRDAARRAAAARLSLGVFVLLGFAAAVAFGIVISLSIALPVNKLTGAMERLAAGDLDVTVEDAGRDEIARLNRSVTGVVATLRDVIDEFRSLTTSTLEGRLDARGDAGRFQGGYAHMVQGVNETLDAVINPLNVAAEYIERISTGDIPDKVTESYNGDFNEIKNNLNKCIDALNTLVADSQRLASSVIAGELDERGDPGKLQGVYAELISTLNRLMDAVAGPVLDSTGALERLANNDTTLDVSTGRPGVWKSLAEAINTLNDRIARVASLAVAASRGDTSELQSLRSIGRRSENDELLPALIRMMQAIETLVADVRSLGNAAVEGRLDARAETGRHEGQFRDVVQGVNDTLDAVVGPLNVAAEYVERISNGDIPDAISESYNGDFNEIKNNLNKCIAALSGLVAEDGGVALQAAVAHDLTVRVTRDYQGAFAKLKDNINQVLNTLADSMRELAKTSGELSSAANELHSTAQEAGTASQQIAEASERVARGSTQQSEQAASASSEVGKLGQSIEELAAGAQHQAAVVESAVSAVNGITQGVSQVAQSAEAAASRSEDVARVAHDGQQSVMQSVEGMVRIRQATEAAAESISRLGEASKEIGVIVEAIDDIAEQTNLLALNAAIEAARAGEHGKGFAVVADEVRKLAERSSGETKQIAERITRIQTITGEAVRAMETGSHEVETGVDLAEQAGKALQKIREEVDTVVQQVGAVSAAAEEMNASSAEVVKAMESVSALTEETAASAENMARSTGKVLEESHQVAAISQENAAAAEEMSAATQEQNASVEELNAAAEELNNVADALRAMVGQFTLSGDTSHDASPEQSRAEPSLRISTTVPAPKRQRKAA